MQQEINKPLTPEQLLSLSPFNDKDTIYKYIKNGTIKAFKPLGTNRWLITQDEANKFLYGNLNKIENQQAKQKCTTKLKKEESFIKSISSTTKKEYAEHLKQQLGL